VVSRELSSCFDKRTHRRLPCPSVIAPAHDGCPPVPFPPKPSAPDRKSIVGLTLPQPHNASVHPQQLAYIFDLPNHASDSCCTAQNNAAGLPAERVFETHLLEKSMLARVGRGPRCRAELYGKPSGSLPLNCTDSGGPVTESIPTSDSSDCFCSPQRSQPGPGRPAPALAGQQLFRPTP
jgi:hypothetical protein